MKKSKNANLSSIKKKESWEILIFALSEASKISFSLVFFPIVFLLGGVWVDKKLNTAPLFIILGIVIGLVTAIYQATKIKTDLMLPDNKNKLSLKKIKK